ncbi:unnamed protein product [Ceutorhynchus assimilis]|uniref:Glycosyltransferase family 92 protein n=1 Tax=Ceutorhynchus assimilis TaxID=467358 RepID=A0A9N9QFT2_9CUCU|nr:unnamed protein product [Ceutorhynchus assimilis]
MPRCLTFVTWLRITALILLMQIFLYVSHYKTDFDDQEDIFFSSRMENLNDYKFIKANFQNASTGNWQNVGNMTDIKFLVFSAFLDIRKGKSLKIISVTVLRRKRPNVWCKLWYKDEEFRTKTVPGMFTLIKEHWSLPYSAYFITCPLDDSKGPDAVSLLTSSEESPKNILKVIKNYNEDKLWDPDSLSPSLSKLAVCVKPLHYDYNKVFELLEFIELHKIMGVDHFYLYNHSVSPQIDCLLQKYQHEGLVTVLPWQLPLISQKEIRTEGIFASLNDCLFRTMHNYSHTIFIDFDEYIIPRNNFTYSELFEQLLESNNNRNKSTFSFKNCFFYRQWPDDPTLFQDPLANNLITLRKTRRKTEFHPHRQRSKFIIRPELVNMVGNHFIWEYFNRRKYGVLDVNPLDAFMHHYRVCEFGGDDCVNQNSTVDQTAYKYKDEMVRAVRGRYNAYMDQCKFDLF